MWDNGRKVYVGKWIRGGEDCEIVGRILGERMAQRHRGEGKGEAVLGELWDCLEMPHNYVTDNAQNTAQMLKIGWTKPLKIV